MSEKRKNPQLTMSECLTLGEFLQKIQETKIDLNMPSEYVSELIESHNHFWEYLCKKYDVDISNISHVNNDGTLVLKQ